MKNSSDNNLILELFNRNQTLFNDLISRNYCLSEKQIEDFASYLNWEKLIKNENIIWTQNLLTSYLPPYLFKYLPYEKIEWTDELIDKLTHKIYWKKFYENKNFLWTEKLLEKHSTKFHFDWSLISESYNVVWSEELIDKYYDKWDWKKLFKNKKINCNKFFLERYYKKWKNNISILEDIQLTEDFINDNQSNIDFFELSKLENVDWSTELIAKFNSMFDWSILSGNSKLPWNSDFFMSFEKKWDYYHLSYNPNIHWTENFIEKYKEKWNWKFLSNNPSLPWSDSFIDKYYEKWDWDYLSENKNAFWSIELIQKHYKKWNWIKLSYNESLPWSEKFLRIFEINLKENIVNFIDNIFWTKDLLFHFEEHINWDKLSSLSNVDWSIETIEEFSNKLNWRKLASNESILWNEEKIEKFIYQLDNEVNKRNSSMPEYKLWSYDLYYENDTDWRWLSLNKNLKTTNEFFDKYIDKIYWYNLVENPSINLNFDFLNRYIEKLNESKFIWDVVSTKIDKNSSQIILEKIKKNKIKIAENLTVNDWENLANILDTKKNTHWDYAFSFLETRINSRYIDPIKAIQNLNFKGEGFAIVSLQCSLIETLESFICGIIHKHPYFYIKNKKSFRHNKTIYINFFNRFKKKFNYLNGELFFLSVRNPLLHETQTKNNWKILLGNLGEEKAYTIEFDKHIIYRNNFHKKLIDIFNEYKYSIIYNKNFYGIPPIELRENFISKFNHICKES